MVLVSALLVPRGALAERGLDPAYELSILGGYGFGGGLELEDAASGVRSKLDFDAGPMVGAMLAVRLRKDEGQLITVSYMREFTSASFKSSRPLIAGLNPTTDVDIGYIQAGGEVDGKLGRFRPFLGMTIGATHISPRASGLDTSWFFSGGLTVGAKFPIGDHFGLRAHGGFMGTLINKQGAVLCSSSRGGCAISVDSITGLLQGNFMGGVYFAF
jgi:hypothetical protein